MLGDFYAQLSLFTSFGISLTWECALAVSFAWDAG